MSEVKREYIGRGKETKYSTKLNICIDDINAYAKRTNIQPAKNGKKYINLELTEYKKPDQFGKTHGISIDTWVKPE